MHFHLVLSGGRVMVFTYLVYLHFLGFESVLFKKHISYTLDFFFFFAKRQRTWPLLQNKNCILLPLFQLSVIYKGAVLTHPKFVNRSCPFIGQYVWLEVFLPTSPSPQVCWPSWGCSLVSIYVPLLLNLLQLPRVTWSTPLTHTTNTAVSYSQSLHNIKWYYISGLCSGFYICLLHMTAPSLMDGWLCALSIYEAALLPCAVDASDVVFLLLHTFLIQSETHQFLLSLELLMQWKTWMSVNILK